MAILRAARLLIGAGVLVLALTLPSAASATPLAWSTPQLIDPGSGLYAGVSCPTSTLCVAAGENGGVVTSTNPAGGAGTWTLADVDGSATMSGISCPSPALCIAVDTSGNVVSSSDPTSGAAAWNVTSVDVDSHGNPEDFGRVSCPTSTLCVASDTAGNVITSTDPTGDASAWTITNVDGSNQLRGVSCPSETFCAIVDDAGNVVTSTNPTGGAGAWTITNVDGTGFPNDLNDISCVSVSLCVAGDDDENVVVSTDPIGGSGAWTLSLLHLGALFGIDCPSASFCVMGNDSGGAVTSTNPTGGVGAWTLTATGSQDFLDGISCPLLSLCVGVDGAGYAVVGTPGSSGEESMPPGAGGQVNPPPALIPAPIPSSASAPIIAKKPLRCRKGFKKRTVHGKPKCVRVKRRKPPQGSARPDRAAASTSSTKMTPSQVLSAMGRKIGFITRTKGFTAIRPKTASMSGRAYSFYGGKDTCRPGHTNDPVLYFLKVTVTKTFAGACTPNFRSGSRAHEPNPPGHYTDEMNKVSTELETRDNLAPHQGNTQSIKATTTMADFTYRCDVVAGDTTRSLEINGKGAVTATAKCD